MKRLCWAVIASAGLWLLAGCATERQPRIVLTGNIMVDGPNAITNGPPRDKLLWEYRTAAADLRAGNHARAREYLDDALVRLGGIYGTDKSAQKARSYFNEESSKTFIGEPYERVMAYFYRGILYWMDGEPDNARACFRSGEIEDSSSDGQQYTGDYVLLDYLDGYVSAREGGDGSDAWRRAQENCKQFSKPPAYDPQANVLVFVEFGPGPQKYAGGRYGEELRFRVTPSPVQSVMIKVGEQTIRIQPYDDLGFQATTRGGRVMDHVLANKAVFKSSTDAAGNVGIIGGAIAASSDNKTAQQVGLGVLAAGIVSKIIAANTEPAADTRAWSNLPRYLTFAALRLPPGQHAVTVQFLDRVGQVMPNLTKTIILNVPADKRDKVVFVSDASPTPQTL